MELACIEVGRCLHNGGIHRTTCDTMTQYTCELGIKLRSWKLSSDTFRYFGIVKTGTFPFGKQRAKQKRFSTCGNATQTSKTTRLENKGASIGTT